jgi:hypothetical protein
MNSKTLDDVNNSFTNLINSNNSLINISEELKKFNGNLISEVDILANKTAIFHEKYNTLKQNYPQFKSTYNIIYTTLETLFNTLTTNSNIASESIKSCVDTLSLVDNLVNMTNTTIAECGHKISTLVNNYDEACLCFDTIQNASYLIENIIINTNLVDKTYDLLIIIIDLNKKTDNALESLESLALTLAE